MQMLVGACLLVGVYARSPTISLMAGSKRCLEYFLYDDDCIRSVSTNEIWPYVSKEPFLVDTKVVDEVYRITKQYGTCMREKHTFLEETCPKELKIVDTLLRLVFETGSTYKTEVKRVLTCLNENRPVRIAVKDCVKQIWNSKVTSTLWGDSCNMVEDVRTCLTLLNSCEPYHAVKLDKFITENKSEICTLMTRLTDYWPMSSRDIDYMYI